MTLEIELVQAAYPDLKCEGKQVEIITQNDRVVILLPSRYPASDPPTVSCCNDQSSLRNQVRQLWEDSGKEECLLDVIQLILERDQQPQSPPECLQSLSTCICAVVKFHHILSTKKRKYIIVEAAQKSLKGVCKPGTPGILVVQGPLPDVHEYLEGIRALRWQSMQVKGEITIENPLQKLEVQGMNEVEKMSDVVGIMKGVGLDNWLQNCLNIRRSAQTHEDNEGMLYD